MIKVARNVYLLFLLPCPAWMVFNSKICVPILFVCPVHAKSQMATSKVLDLIGGGPSTEETIAAEMAMMKSYLKQEFTFLNQKIDSKFDNLNNKLDEKFNGMVKLTRQQFAELYKYLNKQFRNQEEMRKVLLSEQWEKIKKGQFRTSRKAAVTELTGELNKITFPEIKILM